MEEWRIERCRTSLKSASGSPHHRRWQEEEDEAEEDAIAMVSANHSPCHYHSYVPSSSSSSSWSKHFLQRAMAPELPHIRSSYSSSTFVPMAPERAAASAPSTSASSPVLLHRHRHRHNHCTTKSRHIFAKPSTTQYHKAQQCSEKIISSSTTMSEMDMLKERFAKLLLGEDMRGGGRGVSSALAISNAITDLSASVFGKQQQQRLEPLREDLKARWRRETAWLLSVSDHIVEFHPSSQVLHDGNSMEIMIAKPRSDLHMNLPALRKLDTLLIEALESFEKTEFWYVDRPMVLSEEDEAKRERQEEKSWPPIPRVPSEGLSHNTRKWLQRQKDNISQMLKAALAINIQVLNEMEVPATYWDGLPKNARLSLGDRLYHTITATSFSPEAFVISLDPGNNDIMLELVNRIEAALHIWRRKVSQCQTAADGHHMQRTSWGYTIDGRGRVSERRLSLVKKAESLLILLRQRFPGLPQTILDMSKIESNKDVGQSILESYSRALQNLACNILLRIDDVLHVDDLQKRKLLVKPEKPVRLPRSCFRHGGPFICSFTGEASDLSSGTLQKQPASAQTIGTSASPRLMQTRFLGECMDLKMKLTIDATKQLQANDGVHGEMFGT